VSIRFYKCTAVAVLLIGGCGDRSLPISPDARFDSRASSTAQSGATDPTSVSPQWSSSSSFGGTVKEILSGAAIDGVTPRGIAIADQSQFLGGGSTLLTLEVTDVNLPDGTVLGVTLDFTPIGTITLSDQRGSMSANLGHFAVSRDQVRVLSGATQILIGGFFQ
jgi:hypothetical protein